MNKTIYVTGYIRGDTSTRNIYGSTKSLEIYTENISYCLGDYIEYDRKPCVILAMNNGDYILIKQAMEEFESEHNEYDE